LLYEPTIKFYCLETLKPSSTTIAIRSKINQYVAFATMVSVNDTTAEILVMAVLGSHQNRGLGAVLIANIEEEARKRNKQFLMLKTIGPRQNDELADRASHFFRKQGYCMLDEYSHLWQNYSCAIMVKQLGAQASGLPFGDEQMSDRKFQIKELRSNQDKVVRYVLRELPEYFGNENAVKQYGEDAKQPQSTTFAAVMEDGEKAGFATLVMNSESTAEIWVMAVLPEFHRQGIGSALLEKVHGECRREGRQFIMAKTLGPSASDENYLKTFAFYRKNGYSMLVEDALIWRSYPCAFMVCKL